MPSSTPRVLFVFLDGVGIGSSEVTRNPFLVADLPRLKTILGGRIPTLDAPTVVGPAGAAFPLDAGLDLPGTPQSGTGQAALLTGEDAARIHGAHFGPWTPVRLRSLVEERSLLRRAIEAGRRVAFANAYPKGWPGARGTRRIAGPPLAARGAGVLNRHEDELGAGRAVSSEIVNDGWRRHLGHEWLPDVTPSDAGANLAAIASEHDLTLYAHYATDTAGHRREMASAVSALERVDLFLGGLLDVVAEGTLVFIASDHGNIEDVTAGHTSNPALGMALGPNVTEGTAPRDVRDVAAFLLDHIGVT
ncbi:MAG: alkaline phosphatase family protein [Gemmatimonadota bacterium]|nr:alkaline phosphatase family protein [Gemmatimonadota bacterium]